MAGVEENLESLAAERLIKKNMFALSVSLNITLQLVRLRTRRLNVIVKVLFRPYMKYARAVLNLVFSDVLVMVLLVCLTPRRVNKSFLQIR